MAEILAEIPSFIRGTNLARDTSKTIAHAAESALVIVGAVTLETVGVALEAGVKTCFSVVAKTPVALRSDGVHVVGAVDESSRRRRRDAKLGFPVGIVGGGAHHWIVAGVQTEQTHGVGTARKSVFMS